MSDTSVVLLLLVVILAFVVYKECVFNKHVEKLEDRYFAERQVLLDRLMSLDFVQFKQAQLVEKVGIQQQQQTPEYLPENFDILDQ